MVLTDNPRVIKDNLAEVLLTGSSWEDVWVFLNCLCKSYINDVIRMKKPKETCVNRGPILSFVFHVYTAHQINAMPKTLNFRYYVAKKQLNTKICIDLPHHSPMWVTLKLKQRRNKHAITSWR